MITPREQEVIDLVVKGMSNKEIGKQLNIAEKTVKFHLNYIYRKMEVKNRVGLIIKYMRGVS